MMEGYVSSRCRSPVNRPSYTCSTAGLVRLEFDEREEEWIVTEFFSDGHSELGEPFMASGHEHYSKLEQVERWLRDKYPSYRPVRMPYNNVNATHYSLEVVPKQSE